MKCKSCKRDIPPESIFCMHCGEKLVRSRQEKKKEVSVPKPTQLTDGRWRIRLMIEGERTMVYGATAKEAEAAARAVKLGVIEHQKPDNRIVSDCLDEYIAVRENTGTASPSTIDSYLRRRRNNLQSIMGLRIKALTPEAMQAAVNLDAQKYSGKTIHEAVSLVQSATGLKFPDLVKPSKKPKKKPPVYSSDDLRKLILALADIGGQVEVAGLLACWLSLRRSEIKGLRWVDVFDDRIQVVKAQVYDKNHKLVEKDTKTDDSTRTILCDDYIMTRLRALPRDSENVITMSTSGLWKGITAACDKAGIDHGYLHGLRHTNASIMALLKIPDIYANKRGGWSKSHVRQAVYTDAMTEGEIAAAVDVNNYMQGLITYGPELPPGFTRES